MVCLEYTEAERSIWIKGIPATTRAVELKELFANYGRVMCAKIYTRRSDPSTCFGRITMRDMSAVDDAIAQLQNTMFQGQSITLDKGTALPQI